MVSAVRAKRAGRAAPGTAPEMLSDAEAAWLVLLEASHCTEEYSVVIIIEAYMVSSRVSSVVCLSVQITRKIQKPLEITFQR